VSERRGTGGSVIASFSNHLGGLPMTQLRRDAAYIRKLPEERTGDADSSSLTAFDEEVCTLLGTAQTVISATKTLGKSTPRPDLEERVAVSMQRLLEAERIELSPDS
jgi:hypothetical protein